MNYRRRMGLLGACMVVGLFGLPGVSRADEVIIARMIASPEGGMHASTPVKVNLSETKPAGITKEPVYLRTPLYGTISLGNAKDSQITIVLDAAANSIRPRLYIDLNSNGDLTDDRPVDLVPLASATPRSASLKSDADSPRGARVIVDARYNADGGEVKIPSGLTFVVRGTELTYNRDYSREGKLTIGDRTYKAALLDQALDGRFANYKHAEGQPPKVVLLIDRNGNGKFDLPAEAYDLAKPFRLGVSSYEVVSVDDTGTRLSLKKSANKAREIITAADLLVGGDSIAFDVETTDRKKVSFPEDYKGKVVMLDFWATWSQPFRAEVPNIVQVYTQYHPDGFDVLGISIDRPGVKQAVAEYVQQAGMSWPDVYDGGFWNTEVAKLYDVQNLPYAVLIDGDSGKILAMGNSLLGPGLEQAVARALANKKK